MGLEKAASELKKQASPSQKENKTAGKKSSLGNVKDAEVTPTSKTRPKRKCASTETAMVKKKRMMAKQRHERKKLRATARAATKDDNNTKLDEELEKLARELEEPNIGVNRKTELMTLMVDKTVNNAAIKKKLMLEEEESSAIGTTPSSASDESSSSSSSSFRLSSDYDAQEDRKMPAKPSPKLAANKAKDTTSDGKNSPSLSPKKLGLVVTDEKKDKVESLLSSCGAILVGSNNDSYSVRMGPSAASTAGDGPLCRQVPILVTTNVHNDLNPRLKDRTRLIGFKAIPFNSSTFQDDDLEEMLLLVFPTVPSESDTMATPTITSEHKKKLQESLLKLKSEVTMVVSDEIKSMIVRKAQQLKMPIDGEEGHRLFTNWLEILDNWQNDQQDHNFLQIIDCVQI
ncbi:hypothetical protein ACA910_014322 [Epithemia clementina (nom. ined.)]